MPKSNRRKLHSVQLHKLYLPTDIIGIKEGRWMARSCRLHVIWDTHLWLSEIFNHNHQSTPLLGACMYTMYRYSGISIAVTDD